MKEGLGHVPNEEGLKELSFKNVDLKKKYLEVRYNG